MLQQGSSLGFLLVCISVNIMNESEEHPKTRTDPVGHLYSPKRVPILLKTTHRVEMSR